MHTTQNSGLYPSQSAIELVTAPEASTENNGVAGETVIFLFLN